MNKDSAKFHSRLALLFEDNLMKKSTKTVDKIEVSEICASNQTELAEAIQVSRQSISKYMNDGTMPSLDTAIKIAQHFAVSLDYLAGLSEYRSLSVEEKQACEYTGLTESAVTILNANKEDKQHPLKMKIVSQLIESRKVDEIAHLLEHTLVSAYQYDFLYGDIQDTGTKDNMLGTDEFYFNKTVMNLYPAMMEILSKKLNDDIESLSLARWETMLENVEITIEKMDDIIDAVGKDNWKAYQARKIQKIAE